MPMFMDLHSVPGATREQAEQAHLADLDAQKAFGVHYMKYWFNEEAGKFFCFVEAPDREAAIAVHRNSHGFVPDNIIEVMGQDVEDFLGGVPETPHGGQLSPAGGPDPGLRTVLFTDMEGSTALTQRVGDERMMEMVRAHNAIVRESLGACSGREVKHTGDGIMASFVSPSRAIECAISLQRGIAVHNDQHPEQEIHVRVGLSTGEPVVEGDDLFGAAVQLAKRVCDHAGRDQIFVSNIVRELCLGKQIPFADRGRVRLKGFDQREHLHEVRWRDEP